MGHAAQAPQAARVDVPNDQVEAIKLILRMRHAAPEVAEMNIVAGMRWFSLKTCNCADLVLRFAPNEGEEPKGRPTCRRTL